jgi:hypothetical protein
MCVDCVLTSSRIAQVDPGDGPPSEVVLSQWLLEREDDLWKEVVKLKYVKSAPICFIPNRINDSPI